MQQTLLDLRYNHKSKLQSVLDYIDDNASSPARKGILFERLMRQYFLIDPLYKERFSEVYLYKEWASLDASRNPRDLGIDLVAVEKEGKFCAIQCKCYAPTTRITKPDIDSFIAESSRSHFTARIIVDTGGSWGENAIAAITGIDPSCKVIRFRDLAQSPINWPDLSIEPPEQLSLQEPFELKPHQEDAFDDVIKGFENNNRGQMIMACGTRGGVDREYRSDVKTYTHSTETSDVVIGVHPTADNAFVLYFVPTILIEKLDQKSISIQKIKDLKENYYILENCKNEEIVTEKCREYGILPTQIPSVF